MCRLCTRFLAATFYFAQMFDGVRLVSLLFFLVYIHPASTEIYTQIFARHERALDRCERKEYIPEKRARPKFVFISNEAFCLVKY